MGQEKKEENVTIQRFEELIKKIKQRLITAAGNKQLNKKKMKTKMGNKTTVFKRQTREIAHKITWI